MLSIEKVWVEFALFVLDDCVKLTLLRFLTRNVILNGMLLFCSTAYPEL